ncbi:MAG: spore photoproduct lyase [Clostridia bacterium]|nr:spore photoproduct lyase [Clostridia bacterium]
MFRPKAIYFEKEILEYPLGKELMENYKEIPKIEIQNHNNIEEMRKKQNKEFADMKRNLIIGIRKTHKFVENHKTSDYLVPYTSSGCTAACMYCYLVCNYNKCAYLRLFVNRGQMLDKIIKTSEKADKELTFEIGSNSDLILENTITNNLVWTIENFKNTTKGFLTFPTKFDMVDSILPLDHKGKVVIRMSVNPEEIINKVEFGTSRLKGRIEAINQLAEAGYKIGMLIAPVILVDNWKELYENLMQRLYEELSEKVKKNAFFEIIFMTYSYVHTKINEEAFPNAISLYDKEIMTGRGRGKYRYKDEVRKEGEIFLREQMQKYFPNNKIEYIV